MMGISKIKKLIFEEILSHNPKDIFGVFMSDENINENEEINNENINIEENIEENERVTEKTENIVENNNIQMENSEKKDKKTKNKAKRIKEKKPHQLRISFSEGYEKLQSNIWMLIITCVSAFLIMFLVAILVFFKNVEGPEKVLVPNVVGKQLEDALLEMQAKELYPKINLRYSDVPGDEGAILEQSPKAGAIVKGYSRVSLVVSRGVVVDKVDDYVGMNINELQLKLQTLFAGQTKPLIVLGNPKYKPDLSDAGTILEQDPPAGTSISEPVTVELVVSRGPNYENTRPPKVVGQSVNDLLQTITRSKVVFDIKSHIALDDEKIGTVVSQQTFDSEFVPNYSRVEIEMAMPDKPVNDNVYGIFEAKLADYPYPVPMKLEAVPEEGNSYTILSFSHPGGNVTIPYAVPKGTELVLYVVEKVASRQTVY